MWRLSALGTKFLAYLKTSHPKNCRFVFVNEKGSFQACCVYHHPTKAICIVNKTKCCFLGQDTFMTSV